MFCLLEFYQGILTISCFERTAGKCSLTWHSGLVRNCYLQLGLNLSHAMTFIKWIRYSWFHFNIFNKNSKWHGSHGHHIHPPGHFLLFLFLFLLLLFLYVFHRERHTPCKSGLSLHSWNTFYFFEEKIGEKLVWSCNKTILFQGDVTWLTTILTKFK